MTSMILNNRTQKYLPKLPLAHPASFALIFSYLNPSGTQPSIETRYGYIDKFFNGFNNYIDNKNYNDYLNNAIDSIDVYGLGFYITVYIKIVLTDIRLLV